MSSTRFFIFFVSSVFMLSCYSYKHYLAPVRSGENIYEYFLPKGKYVAIFSDKNKDAIESLSERDFEIEIYQNDVVIDPTITEQDGVVYIYFKSRGSSDPVKIKLLVRRDFISSNNAYFYTSSKK